jgi:hypothetical protein
MGENPNADVPVKTPRISSSTTANSHTTRAELRTVWDDP